MSSLGRLSIFLMVTLVGSTNIYAQNNARINLRDRLPGAGGAQVSLKTLRLNIRIFSVSNNRARRTLSVRPVIATGYRPSYMSRKPKPTKGDMENVKRLVLCHSDITDITFVKNLKQLSFFTSVATTSLISHPWRGSHS